jgi:hypothetical protein
MFSIESNELLSLQFNSNSGFHKIKSFLAKRSRILNINLTEFKQKRIGEVNITSVSD